MGVGGGGGEGHQGHSVGLAGSEGLFLMHSAWTILDILTLYIIYHSVLSLK